MSFTNSISFQYGIPTHLNSQQACKCSGGITADASATILEKLREYPSENKLLIVLAAFAMIYGQFWLVSQSYNSNQVAKSVAILKRSPYMFMQANVLKSRFDAVKKLNSVILDITKCIVEITRLTSQYTDLDDRTIAEAVSPLPTAVKQTIKSIVTCAYKINEIGLSSEQLKPNADPWGLSSSTHKLKNTHSHLAELLKACLMRIDKRRIEEEFEHLKDLLKTGQADNVIVLSALFGAKDEPQPLYDLAHGKRVNLDVLRGKYVLLFVTDVDIPQEDLAILEKIYNESRSQLTKDHLYEIVWLPVPNILHTPASRKLYEDLQMNLKWLRVDEPSLISTQAVILRCMEDTELFNFWKQPILSVLDTQGKLASRNALPMMWIWESLAFPFTADKEKELWAAASWKIDFIVGSIDQQIADWISVKGRYIFLYGGEDIDWIREFTTAARSVAKDAGITLQMVYIGKKNPKERVKNAISTIKAENLSYTLNLTKMSHFWVRLESMFFSKQELDSTVDSDPIMAEVAATLNMGGSGSGFAILGLSKAAEMVRANGGSFLNCLSNYLNIWKAQVQEKGFMQALIDHLREIPVPQHCCKFEVLGTSRGMPENLKCPVCNRSMERMTVYQCCDD